MYVKISDLRWGNVIPYANEINKKKLIYNSNPIVPCGIIILCKITCSFVYKLCDYCLAKIFSFCFS